MVCSFRELFIGAACVFRDLLTPRAFPELPEIESLSLCVDIIIDSFWQMRLPVLTGPPVWITQSDSHCGSSHRHFSSLYPKIRSCLLLRNR